MKSYPLNTPNYIGLDYETTGLPNGQHFRKIDGKINVINPLEKDHPFRDVASTEFGFWEADKDHITHLQIDFSNPEVHSRFIPGSGHKRLITNPLTGEKVTVDAYHVQQTKPSDILDLVSKGKVRGKKADALAQPFIKKALGSRETMFVFEGKHMSEFALKSMAQSKGMEQKIKADYPLMDFKHISQREFAGKGTGSLYGTVDSWLKKATKDKPLILGAWNPFFDINKMIGDLKKFGYIEKALELERSYKAGIVEIDAIEKYWQSIVFRLSKEDPAFAAHFLIGTHAEASFATGRAGRVARTMEEMEHAALWKAEFVGKTLEKHFGLKPNQLHAAGPDVHNEVKNIKQALFEIAQKGGVDFSTMTKVDAAGNLHAALGGKTFTGNLEETFGKETIAKFKKFIADAQEQVNVHRKIPTMMEAVGKGKSAAINLKRFGGIGVALALAGYVTYGRGEDSLFPFSSGTKFGTMKKPKPIKYNNQFEVKANYSAQALQGIGFGIVGPAAALYAIGRYREMAAPQKLGFIPKRPDTLKKVTNTMYRGILQIEEKFPISRVFGISNSIDFLQGTYQHPTVNAVTKEKRAFSFYSIKSGTKQTVAGTGKNVHGFQYNNILSEAEKTLSAPQFEILKEKFAPTKVPDRVASRQIIVSTSRGKTTIAVSDLDEFGINIAAKYTQDLPFGLHINNLKGQKQLNRLEWALQQSDMIRLGTSKRTNFADHYANLETPDFIKRTPEWEGVYKWIQKARHKLDILPKGIGEGANSIYTDQPSHMTGVKYGAHVTSLEGDAIKTAKAMTGYGMKVPRNLFIDKMNQFLEAPFEIMFGGTKKVEKIAHKLGKSENILTALAGKTLGIMARPHLGLPSYDMKYGFPEYMAKMGLKRILPVYAAYEAFKITNHLLGKLTLSPDGRGPLTDIPIKAYEAATLLYSKISDITGFTRLSKNQERMAPGSTGLGIMAPALSATFTYGTAKLLYNNGPSIIKDSIDKIGSQFLKYQPIKNAMKVEKFKGALNRSPLEKMMSFAIHNPKKGLFALMMAPMLPFFPGVIGSNKSYAERKAEYSGKKEVAIRKYRGWLLSPSPYAGGKPIQFRKHFLALTQSGYEDRGVIWPSFGKHMLHDLTLGLANRYALEEYHAQDQPVYESAPYGANIPFIGPLIAASIGKVIKPTVTYHKLEEAGMNVGITPSYAGAPFSHSLLGPGNSTGSTQEERLGGQIGLTSEGSVRALTHRWSRQFHDLIGFTGFSYETMKNTITGKSTSDEFVPYAQSAAEMYNPAQQMWGLHLGDITGVGGEFLRRIYPYPLKNWKINNIPNELAGVSWIPQKDPASDEIHPFKKLNVDITHGTTFDKSPLGWLYGSRKGWEFLHPEIKGMDLEQYSDPIRLEVLKAIAPYSKEFTQTSEKVMHQAIGNSLTPEREQQYYDTVNQVRQLKEQLYANESEMFTPLDTQHVKGRVESVDQEGGLFLQGDSRKYKLAGVSLADADIRARLLQTKKFDSAADLQDAMQEIKDRTTNIIAQRLSAGTQVSLEIPQDDNISGTGGGVEAIIGGLNDQLNDAGAPFKNTGNLAEHNMQQDRAGASNSAMSKFWNGLTDADTFWNRKLIPNRDYMHSYLQTQVFNREVKLWYKPIDHFVKPMVASILHRGILGIHLDKIPTFTVDRRKKQEYWDILRYVKYKSLAVRASKSGNEEEATKYHNLWRATMIGANAAGENTRDIIAALPQNERPYFAKFSTEGDPKKRAEIMKYLPRSAKRIYSALWAKQMAEQSNDPKQKEILENLEETEGWGITPEEDKMYENETGGNTSKADWIRAKYVNEYMKNNAMPGSDWAGWDANVNEENVELLALRDQGEQIEDYGFFESKARVAAYDEPAYAAAMQLNSTSHISHTMMQDVMSNIIQNDRVSNIQSMPTQSNHPVINMEMDNHESNHRDNQSRFLRYADIMIDTVRFL